MMENNVACPLCGTSCRIVGGEDEPGPLGTRYYEPVALATLASEMLDEARETVLKAARRWRFTEEDELSRSAAVFQARNALIEAVDRMIGLERPGLPGPQPVDPCLECGAKFVHDRDCGSGREETIRRVAASPARMTERVIPEREDPA